MIQEYTGEINTKLVSYDKGDLDESVMVYLFGEEDGEFVQKKAASNDGLFVVAYPEGWHGESKLQVRDGDGNVLDEGTVTV